jgi:Flp pilus assembly protein TadG
VRKFLRLTSRGGQAAVEFALVMPFLLMFVIGIIEFGRAWNLHQVITDAARETARRACLGDDPTLDEVKLVAKDALARAGIPPARATITVDGLNGESNTLVTVGIDLPYRFTFFGALVGWISGGTNIIVLKTSFIMRNE